MVKVHSGLWVAKWSAKKASTLFTKGEFVEIASGYVQPATSSSASLMGVNQDNAIAASDATTDKILIWVPKSRGALVEADVTATVTVGGEYDLSDSDTVNQGASTNDPVVARRVISSTKALFSIKTPQIA